MHLGVVHYIVKPFTFATLRERLVTYATLKAQLDHLQQADQPEIDRLYRLLRTRDVHESLPKGISAPTLTHVIGFLRESSDGTLVGRAREAREPEPGHRSSLSEVPGRLRHGQPDASVRGCRAPRAHLPLGGEHDPGSGLEHMTGDRRDDRRGRPPRRPAGSGADDVNSGEAALDRRARRSGLDHIQVGSFVSLARSRRWPTARRSSGTR